VARRWTRKADDLVRVDCSNIHSILLALWAKQLNGSIILVLL